jgi:hypothetical protein
MPRPTVSPRRVGVGVITIGTVALGLIRCSFRTGAVTHVVPSPRARRARQKLHAAWMTESNRLGRPLLSWWPRMEGITIAGASGCSG